ncbi:hypothetical protein [Facklamia sp. P9177]|uniref:hypothetical protein n=1 Tax=Facklamia sp. P9177 TaxID=3421945 RepID=UPI003D165E08
MNELSLSNDLKTIESEIKEIMNQRDLSQAKIKILERKKRELIKIARNKESK